MNYIKQFSDISISDIPLVGGKNASLGQMYVHLATQGIKVPNGFAITAQAYWDFLTYNHLTQEISDLLLIIATAQDIRILQETASQIREKIVQGNFPQTLASEITDAYHALSANCRHEDCDVAVRSSATAEDLPNASFAGQQESYLNITGSEALLFTIKRCFASLFTDRAIVYRIENNFDHMAVALSVGVQKMIRSDKASSGVIFTLDTESGFKDVVVITSGYGLGENIVQGIVNPDEFHVYKPTLRNGYASIIKKKLGNKQSKLIYTDDPQKPTCNLPVSIQEQSQFSLTESEILELARMAVTIEDYYSQLNDAWSPMDIEWGKDGIDGQLYILQARPETIHSRQSYETITHYRLIGADPNVLVTGQSIGQKMAAGKARLIHHLTDLNEFNKGDILVTKMTDPDWVPIMKKAAAIITDNGGRTCHAAIVARELGIPALVGTLVGTQKIVDGMSITVDCSKGSQGYVYEGIESFEIITKKLNALQQPPVEILLNIADPEQAYELSFLPVSGVGLARLEFIISNMIKIHPMAIVKPECITDEKIRAQIADLSSSYANTKEFYIDVLAQGMSTLAAAFYPKPVIIRLSDFKSNEYRNLIGGNYFEPIEENSMIGFRGAARYCDANFKEAFALECAAFKKARTTLGMKNIKLMVPFVRTLSEAQCTIDALASHGLVRGQDELTILMMCELPANVLMLEELSQYFDGFSIGSNDLTQLTLGVDRDSGILQSVFDERDPAVQKMLIMAVEKATRIRSYISICGQAPSDYPEIADLLIAHGIDALSLNPDAIIPTIERLTS